jgi:hypothetical protein
MSQVQLINLSITDLKCLISDVMKQELLSVPSAETQSTEKKRLYGDKAGADHIGCTPLTMGKLRKAGKVRFYTLGTRYYYYAHELDEDLRGGKKRFGELRGNRKGAKV